MLASRDDCRDRGIPPKGDHVAPMKPLHDGRAAQWQGNREDHQVLLSILMVALVLAGGGLLVTLIVLEWPSD